MRSPRRPPLLALPLLAIPLLAWAPSARAEGPYRGTRPLGMGGALRAAASGDTGPLLNPSGMSLVRSYAVEGGYQHDAPGNTHYGHVSIVDSTSASNIAGGVYYTYANGADEAAGARVGHEGGLALSFPFSDRFAVGATGKYVRDSIAPRKGGSETDTGLTVDVGTTIRPAGPVSLGLVGYNLRDLKTRAAPVAVGAGLGLGLVEGLILEVDGVLDFNTHDEKVGRKLSVMGGGEYLVLQRFAVRAGGGRDGNTERGYFTVGGSLVSEIGAIDAGFRQDVSGNDKATLFAISLRLFVDAGTTAAPPAAPL